MNRHAVLRVSVATVGILLTFALATGCGARRAQQQTELGDTYLQLGKYADAAESYQAALDADPDNAGAQLGLARCLWAQREPEAAVTAYEKAIELAPDEETGYREAVRILIELNRADEAEALAKKLSERAEEPGGLLLAYVYRETGRTQEAVDLLKTLKEKSPRSDAVRVGLATLYLAANDPAGAEQELKAVLEEVNPESPAAQMALIEVYRSQNRLPEYIAQLRQLSEQQPDRTGVKIALARALLDTGEYEEAETIASTVLEEFPESPWANYVMGSCLLEKEDFQGSVICLQAAARLLPEESLVTEKLALAASGRKTPAPETTAAIGEEGQATPAAGAAAEQAGAETWQDLWRMGSLGMLSRNWEKYAGDEDPLARPTLALATVFTGNLDAAEKIAAELPADSPLHAYLGALKAPEVNTISEMIQGWQETEDTRAQLRENAVGYALARIGARAQAMAVFSECLNRWPDNAVPLYNLAGMYSAARMPDFAARVLDRLLTLHPNNMEARQLLFSTYYQADKRDEARQLAERSYSLYPDRVETLLSLARSYRDSGDTELAQNVLRSGIEKNPGNPALVAALGETLVYEGKAEEALAEFAKVKGDKRLMDSVAALAMFAHASEGDWESAAAAGADGRLEQIGAARMLRVSALIQLGKSEEAREVVKAGSPERGAAVRELLLAALGDPDARVQGEMAEFAQSLQQDAGVLATCTYGLALAEAGMHERAFETLRALSEETGNAVLAGYALASLARAPGVEGRLATAQAVAEANAGSPLAWIGYAEVCGREGDREAQIAALQKAVELAPDNTQALARLAQAQLEQGLSAQALESYRRLSQLEPENPYWKNNQSYLMLETNGDPATALQLAEEALKDLPVDPNLFHTLGLAHLRTNNLEESRRYLQMALEMRPGDPTILLDFGNMLIQSGNREEGRRQIQSALRYADQIGVEFPRRSEAEQIAGS